MTITNIKRELIKSIKNTVLKEAIDLKYLGSYISDYKDFTTTKTHTSVACHNH